MPSHKSESSNKVRIKDTFFSSPEFSVDFDEHRIDFLVYSPLRSLYNESFLWAEAKREITDVHRMFAQLLLTIKKTYDKGDLLPPKFLSVFDNQKIIFVEFHHVLSIFDVTDFNWNERPSAVSDKTIQVVKKFLDTTTLIEFKFKADEKELKEFIKTNFVIGSIDTVKIQITKNNFIRIFYKWAAEVCPTIIFHSESQNVNIADGDFFLADVLSKDNVSLYKELHILLQGDYYRVSVEKKSSLVQEVFFNDGGKAHQRFWETYQRPPKEEYHTYMKSRRELLIPAKVRERKGSFFTPQIWVEKSQEYMAKVFGENWQEEYYIWDCCAGTGNLLVGLVNKNNIWASTLDDPDVSTMRDYTDHGLNLDRTHIFQFDFLNDEFLPQSKGGKMPDSLYKVISDPKTQKKLIVYINPPYAEATSSATVSKTGKHKAGVTTRYAICEQLNPLIGKATNDMLALFLGRICRDLPVCFLANFSKIKYLNSTNFKQFREFFRADFKGGFLAPSRSFDNVKGHFPIGFTIWTLEQKKELSIVSFDVFDIKGNFAGKKRIFCKLPKNINRWIKEYDVKNTSKIIAGFMGNYAPDFLHIHRPYITVAEGTHHINYFAFTGQNFIEGCIYFTVRSVVDHTWLNDRDQFLSPTDAWQRDKGFQMNCLIYTLFHSQNRIKSAEGINHWIPFSAMEVGAKQEFKSTFMSDYLHNRKWSKEAKAVFEAGKVLWTYYHQTIRDNNYWLTDASLYEIREYFKGRDENGRLKTKSNDERFNELDAALRSALKNLAVKIQPKVYEYGFLRK